jgi:glycosyltransferase involved in cell wall biosynthesis
MSATVSILTACYNCESTIAKNIESSLKQTYDQKLIELIFIDDGSTDKTLSILEKYKKLYPSRIKMSSRENRGVCKTFQELIAQVNTDYFIFADADDYLSNTAIESLVYEAKKNNADISTGKTIGIKPNGKMHSLNYNNNFRNNMSASAFVLHNASYI